MTKPMMILIAGPYRSGTGDDPVKMAENLRLHPTAGRLLQHCDAVLRLPGDSKGADNDVAIATARGIPVYRSIEEVPDISGVTGSAAAPVHPPV